MRRRRVERVSKLPTRRQAAVRRSADDLYVLKWRADERCTARGTVVAQSVSVPVTAEERYVAELRARIARGDVEAEVALGNLYESGQSVLPLDPAQAAEWYRRAADKGHAGAQMNLAMMYLDGQGVARNVPQAVAWYEKAADGGDAIAMFSLGSIYESWRRSRRT